LIIRNRGIKLEAKEREMGGRAILPEGEKGRARETGIFMRIIANQKGGVGKTTSTPKPFPGKTEKPG
jgi:hypothetical protein